MIFKKQISVLIAFLVLVSNSGLAFNIHFCEGKIASVTSVFSKEEVCEMPLEVTETCCAKIETTHKKCCSDKVINLKDNVEKDVVKISFSNQLVFIIPNEIIFYFGKDNKINTPQKVAYNCDANAPPLYQLYCQYTFYA